MFPFDRVCIPNERFSSQVWCPATTLQRVLDITVRLKDYISMRFRDARPWPIIFPLRDWFFFLMHLSMCSEPSFFFCNHAPHISYTHITWAARNERRTGQRVDRYTYLELSRHRGSVHNYVDYTEWFLQPHRKLQAYVSDSVWFVRTNKVKS